MTRLLPIVACSPTGIAPEAAGVEGRPASNVAPPVGAAGRTGSGVEGVALPVWFGFHMMYCFLSSFRRGSFAGWIRCASLCVPQRLPVLRPRYYFVNPSDLWSSGQIFIKSAFTVNPCNVFSCATRAAEDTSYFSESRRILVPANLPCARHTRAPALALFLVGFAFLYQ